MRVRDGKEKCVDRGRLWRDWDIKWDTGVGKCALMKIMYSHDITEIQPCNFLTCNNFVYHDDSIKFYLKSEMAKI